MAFATNTKSTFSSSVTLLLVVMLVVQLSLTLEVKAQAPSCSNSLANLNVCAPFVVPGAANTSPNQDCCSALQAVDHDCYCNTLRVASRLPSQCNMPPLSCPAN